LARSLLIIDAMDTTTATKFKTFLETTPDQTGFEDFLLDGLTVSTHISGNEQNELQGMWERRTSESAAVLAELDTIINGTTSSAPPPADAPKKLKKAKAPRTPNWLFRFGLPVRDDLRAAKAGHEGEDLVFAKDDGSFILSAGNRYPITIADYDFFALSSQLAFSHTNYTNSEGQALQETAKVSAAFGAGLVLPLWDINENAGVNLILMPMTGIYAGHITSKPSPGGKLQVYDRPREIDGAIVGSPLSMNAMVELQVGKTIFGVGIENSITWFTAQSPDAQEQGLMFKDNESILSIHGGF
jgi:hypothetical protein